MHLYIWKYELWYISCKELMYDILIKSTISYILFMLSLRWHDHLLHWIGWPQLHLLHHFHLLLSSSILTYFLLYFLMSTLPLRFSLAWFVECTWVLQFLLIPSNLWHLEHALLGALFFLWFFLVGFCMWFFEGTRVL